MHREREHSFNTLFRLINLLGSFLSFLFSYWAWHRFARLSLSNDYIIVVLLMVITWFVLFHFINFVEYSRTRTFFVIVIEYGVLVTLGLSILFFLIFLLKLSNISRGCIFLFGTIDILMLCFTTRIALNIARRTRKKGGNTKKIMVVADDNTEVLLNRMSPNNIWGYRIKAIVTNSINIKRKYEDLYPIYPLTSTNDIIPLLEKLGGISEVMYCKNELDPDDARNLVYFCQQVGITFSLKSYVIALATHNARLNYFGETPFFTFRNSVNDVFLLWIKKILGFLIALFALIVFSPVFLIIAILIKSTSKGPIFFKQKRVGLHGKKFEMYKFRTMVVNAEELKKTLMDKNEVDGPVFKIKHDPRVTKVGDFLRKTSLDEFPQFINVIKGEMAVVGPRPPLPDEVKKYERWQMRRLSMKPGITCIWQVSGRNNISFEEWMRMDLEYIDTWSLKLDIYLLLRTVQAVIKRTGF